jgi:hypothetical protein
VTSFYVGGFIANVAGVTYDDEVCIYIAIHAIKSLTI